jgi:amino acid adenylation domain-containing protein
MRSAAELLAHLDGLDIRVWAEGSRLRISAPKGALTASLRDELAARKEEILRIVDAQPPATRPATAAPDGRRAPVSFAQLRLWFLDQLHPGTAEYNIAGAIRLRGDLDAEALDRSLREIVRRHEAMRTIFAQVDGEAFQVVTAPPADGLRLRDVADDAGGDVETLLRRLMLEEARRPFDLARGPIFRATLLKVNARDHVLILVVHHIVADGWSAGVFVRELSALYEAYVTGRPSPLPELPIQYADFAQWQRQWLTGAVLDKELGYWTRRLAGHSAVLELPGDRPRPAVQTFRGALLKTQLPKDLSEALSALSRQEGVTLFMTVLAGFKALLFRYTGIEDLVVGTPIANRTRVDTEGLIGFFANTVVLRTDLSGDPAFRDLLRRIREVALDAYAHQDVPFEKIVEAVQPPRDMSRTPLVQVMFSYQNFPVQDIELPGVVLRPIEFDRGLARMDLTLEVFESPDGLKLAFEYSTDLFDEATIAAMAGHLETLLAGAVADPTRTLAALPLVGDDERRRLIEEWNATDAGVPAVSGVHELVAQQARRTPDAVAVVFEDRRLTYRELTAAADGLARRLRALGVRPGVVVGLCVERSLDMLVGLLGILEAGGAYVPLDPAYPAERLAFMLQDAGCPVLVTQSRLRDGLPPHQAHIVLLDAEPGEGQAEHRDAGLPSLTPDDRAYVIYTSGSTGRPKGVQIPHRALVNLLASMSRTPGLTERDVLLAVTTLSFDIAGLELFLPLTVGARVVVASREAALDSVRLGELVATHGVTAMQATPATWRLLLESGWRAPAHFKILCGGEALPRELADRILASGAAVWNVYGPTETTIWSTLHPVTDEPGPVPIGRPIANTQLYVLDPRGEPTPIGIPGELYIGGDGVALGYLGRPDLTAERFVADRFRPAASRRLYRTGDLVRYRRDGNAEFLGRLDDQVKIRGFRIELGEIEAVLARHPAVAQAVVAARDERTGGKRLAAYLVPAGAALPAVGELRAFVAAALPDYMIPSTFTALTSLPLTPNGKVDRRRLPAPDVPKTDRPASVEGPRTDIETAVSAIWRAVLDVAEVGMNDNFFDLGGHSLLIVQVHTRLRSVIDHDLSIIEMFQYPTVRSLSERLSGRSATAPRLAAR